MALIKTWPESTSTLYDNKQWKWNEWATGTPITQGKLENLENGVGILATQIKAILGEFNPSSLDGAQLNASRLDKVQEWITGNISGTYNSTNIASRLSSIDTLNSTQNNRLDSIESVNSTQSTDISSLKTRATNLENRATTIETLNTTQNGRLNSIENKNTEQDGRLDNIDTLNTQQNNKLTAIVNEIGGTGSDGTNTSYGGTSRIDNLATEVWGSNTTSGTSRIDKNENKIAAIAAELGGTAPDGSSTTYGGTTRLDSVITEVWGTNTTNGDSRIDKLTTELYGSNTTNYDNTSRLDSAITKLSQVTTELYGSDDTSVTSRLDNLEKEVGGTRTSNGTGYTNSRIDAIETLNTTQNNRLTDLENRADSIETLNTTQNDRLDTLTTEIYGSNDTSIASRLNDLEKEICGETIARAEDGGYNNSRIDRLELKVGNGAIGIDNDISAAIRRLSDTVAALDPTGSAEAVGFLVSEVWGQSFSEDTDFTANSRIDNLKTTTQSLGTQLATLATEQNELEQNLVATDAKIPIELYEATNSSASDTIVLNDAPRDKSIFFIAIPQGTLGINNLKLETNDITFRDENGTTVTVKKNFSDSLIAKFPSNSLISIYRNGANAYVYNVPMVL